MYLRVVHQAGREARAECDAKVPGHEGPPSVWDIDTVGRLGGGGQEQVNGHRRSSRRERSVRVRKRRQAAVSVAPALRPAPAHDKLNRGFWGRWRIDGFKAALSVGSRDTSDTGIACDNLTHKSNV